MKITLKDISFLVILATMAFFLFDGCEAKKKLAEQSIDILNYEDSVTYYKSRTGDLIASNEAMVISNVEQVKGLEEKLEDLKLKKAKVVVEYVTSTEIKEVEVAIDIPCEDFELPFEVDLLNSDR